MLDPNFQTISLLGCTITTTTTTSTTTTITTATTTTITTTTTNTTTTTTTTTTPQYGNSLKIWVQHGSKIDLKRYF